MAARDDTTAVKKKGFRLANKTRKEPDLSLEASEPLPTDGTPGWRGPESAAAAPVSSSLAEDDETVGGGGLTKGPAVLSARDLMDSAAPAKNCSAESVSSGVGCRQRTSR